MTTTEPPDRPDSLPGYLANGLPKQDSATLRAIKSFIDELLAYRVRQVESEQPPQAAEPVGEDSEGEGTLIEERVKCGDESCHCMSGGEKHGPYLYRYFREGVGLKSEYVGKPSD